MKGEWNYLDLLSLILLLLLSHHVVFPHQVVLQVTLFRELPRAKVTLEILFVQLVLVVRRLAGLPDMPLHVEVVRELLAAAL